MRRLLVALVLLAAGCGGTATPAPVRSSDPLSTLRKVDDFPLYEMSDTLPTPSVYVSTDTTGWACTVFMGAGGDPIVGRNFDFHDEPALLLHHHPPGAYASVSLVDISYLGFDRAHLDRLEDPVARRGLLRAARMPFDGMNERGLVVAMAQVPVARSPHRAGQRTTGQLGVMRLVLDHAATVDEAAAIFRRTAIDFSGDPPLHYLVADPSGASAVIEYIDGRVHVVPRGARPFQAMTNFTLSDSTRGERERDQRYHTAMTALARAGGRLEPDSTLDLLSEVSQPITRWSAAYDMRARTVHVVMGQQYERVLTFGVT